MAACSACGKQNPDEARFCLACGTPFAPPEPPREERKVITALFTDIVGSTARAEQLDPEDVRAMLQPYYTRLRTELERFGGTVEKFIGDAVVALFGAPVAHEDDPERAVRAALAIRRAIDELNEADDWLDLKIRIGVNTGEALVVLGARPSEGEGMAAGDVLNTAARLQSNAPVNGILVGEATHRATAHAIEYREAPSIEAKGKAAPVRVWEAIGAVEATPRRPAPQTPLVGRRDELAALDAVWRDVTTAGEAAVALVAGPPGIGKTRVICEFEESVAPAARVHWGRCLSYGEGITYWPVTEIVKEAAGILRGDDAATVADRLGALVDALPTTDQNEVRTIAAALANLAGAKTTPRGTYAVAEIGQAELHWGIRRLIELLAAERATVLVLEDLHWAEPTLLELVRFLAASPAPILVVGSARPELADDHPEFVAGARTVTLEALSGEESQGLLAELLSVGLLADASREALLETAGGNPLFLEQTVRMLAEGEHLAPNEGPLPVPTNLQSLIGARLDQLPTDQKRAVQHASVVGTVFWPGALAHLEGGANGTLGTRLASLERRDLVRTRDLSTVAGEREYAFRHALIRDVAYAQLPKGRRAALHLECAEWIALRQGTGEELVEIVAYHLEQSCRLAREVAHSPVPPPIEMAVEALTRAAQKAERREGIREADRFYERALELVDDERSATALELRLARCGTLVALGELSRAHSQLVEIGDEALRVERRDLRCHALLMLANVDGKRGRARATRGTLKEAEALASEIGDRYLQVRALFELSNLLEWFEGASALALETLEQALALADEVGDRSLKIEGHMRTAAQLFNAGRLAAAEHHLRSAIELADDLGSQRDEARAASMLAFVRYYRGDWDEAERLASEALVRLERTGDTYLQLQNVRTLAMHALARGDPRRAERRLQEALPLALELGGWLVIEIYRYLADALVRQRRIDEARDIVAFAARDVPDEDAYARAALALAEATVATAAGEHVSATASFDQAVRLLEDQGLVTDLAEARLAFARALRSFGDVTAARTELERARTSFKRMDADSLLEQIDREVEELAERPGPAGPSDSR